MVEYKNNGKNALVNGFKFTRDNKTGYYLSSKRINGKRRRLHVYMWEFHNGEIPKGYEIHHKDENKSNNEICNLEMITGVQHRRIHADEFMKNEERVKESTRYLLELAQPKAIEWHKSKEGREWHKQHYEEMKGKLHKKEKYICKNCGKEFKTAKGNNKFCSNNCKSAWRRKQGLDNEIRICIICGKKFATNKYLKVKTCSIECGRESRCLTIQKSKVLSR